MNASPSTRTRPSITRHRGPWLEIASGERRGPLAALARLGLAVLAPAYRAGLAVADLRFRLPGAVRRAPCPVVSVGNLTVGGTGKTPMVAYLARLVADMGRRPVIVSRGYGGAGGGPNEESLELERLAPGVPHIRNPDRWQALQDWTATNACDLAILDDGFQHRRLARDLDIVLIDALRPFGFGHVLPRGLLREPLLALGRAGLVVITRAELVGEADLRQIKETLGRRVRPGTPILVARHLATGILAANGSERAADWLRGQDVAAACGIGNPEAFHRTLEHLGARVRLFDIFPDHYAYTRADLDRLAAAAQAAGVKTLVTTGKDFVKWRPILGARGEPPATEVVAVEVAFRLAEGEQTLRRQIVALLPGLPGLGDR